MNMTKCINASEHMKGSITRFSLCPYFSEISFLAFISAILHYKSEGGEVPSKYLLRLSAAQTLGKVCFILQRIGGERKKDRWENRKGSIQGRV